MKTHIEKFTVLTTAILLSVGSIATGQTPATPETPAAGADSAADFTIPTRSIEMKPTEKRPLNMKDLERNPYAKRAPEEEEVADIGEDSEENRVRSKLLSMSIGGISQSNNGLRLLVGDLILEKGKLVDQLIPDQTEFLRVLDITEEEIKFGWLDVDTGDLTGKEMQIAYNLDPVVRQILPGQYASKGDVEMGVIHVGTERKRQAAEYKKINPKNRMSQAVYERAQ